VPKKIRNGREMFLIDCPGYLDTYGFFRIISNRFFHYQVFSKVQNVQFLVTIAFPDIRGGAEGMKTTFKEFLSSFSNLNSIRNEIFNATSVMITAVPKGEM
jgi:hypothetical protein